MKYPLFYWKDTVYYSIMKVHLYVTPGISQVITILEDSI